MSKFYILNDLISLSNYSKKYNVNLRKIYRYIADSMIEHYMVDNVPYLPDEEIPLLLELHSRYSLQHDVKILTSKVLNVKDLTLRNESVDNQDIDDVKILTLEQKRIIDTIDVKLNSIDLGKKYKILNLLEELKKI